MTAADTAAATTPSPPRVPLAMLTAVCASATTSTLPLCSYS